jgi:bifunctional non-homologous end joining protein LigD
LREDKQAQEVVRESALAAAPIAQATNEEARSEERARRKRPRVQATVSQKARSEKTQQALGPLSICRVGAKSAQTIVEGRELKLSNLDKVLYPKARFTKGDLIAYYAQIAPVLLGHLAERALTVTRWPDGVQGKSFFQKQAPAHRPQWVRTATVASERKPIDYTLADDLPTLVWLANLAAIELHVPLARAQAIERPTALVFDLDPGAPASIVECCHVGLQLHGMFEHLGLHSFAKTSGSKGLQVYVPLNTAETTFERTKPFAKAVAELLEGAEPDVVVSRMTKARRTGKVLIDWSQNDAKKTTVCVYSLRARERPTVSTPVEWDEVRTTRDSGDPAGLAFEAPDVLARVAERGDLFAPVLSLVQELPAGRLA